MGDISWNRWKVLPTSGWGGGVMQPLENIFSNSHDPEYLANSRIGTRSSPLNKSDIDPQKHPLWEPRIRLAKKLRLLRSRMHNAVSTQDIKPSWFGMYQVK